MYHAAEFGCKGKVRRRTGRAGANACGHDFLRFFSVRGACAAAGTARTGGFFPPDGGRRCFSAMLFFSASIRSMTGASLDAAAAATSWPCCLASIIVSHAFLVLVFVLFGSNCAARLSMSCSASFFSAAWARRRRRSGRTRRLRGFRWCRTSCAGSCPWRAGERPRCVRAGAW